ncbi:MAG: LysM peptidoglycan-binding domain-containing protein [Bacteroidota bacterium]|nr:LysM peptidoglycan-binding domain-containing protein [Bacteroidota bacterium]
MQNVRNILIFIFLFAGFAARSQDETVIQNYISTYKDIAIAEMQRTGVPAAIKLAQGIHETMAGTSDLVIKSNNHFGIKCKDTWKGESVFHDDDLKGECFRKYNSPADSYRDHSDFLKGSPRYAPLFKLDPLNYSAWAYGLKKAGYATNPRYPEIIIKLIEDYHLQDYTLIAMGKGPVKDEILAQKTDEKKETGTTAAVAAVVRTEEPVKAALPATRAVTKDPEYPLEEFKINETRVIYAKEGVSFLSIAQQYNIPLARIFEFNDMKEREVLEKDQLVYLQRKRKTGNNEFHIVRPEETLYDIAQAEAIRIESLLEYNQLQQDMRPAVGDRLYLRAKAPARPELAKNKNETDSDAVAYAGNMKGIMTASLPATPNSTKEIIEYTVHPQETIYSISKKYNVKIDDLVQWNQLNSYDLKTGQQLKIYK